MKWIANLTGGYTSSAKVVDGALVLSLPDAVSPVVWRMELGQVKSSALEVREQDNGTFVLTLKTPKGDVTEIAPFAERAPAIKALMAVSAAMEQAQGRTRPVTSVANDDGIRAAEAAPAHAAPPVRKGGSVAASVIGVLILIGMVYALIALSPGQPGGMDAQLAATTAPAGSGDGTAGVPVSADDFLRSR